MDFYLIHLMCERDNLSVVNRLMIWMRLKNILLSAAFLLIIIALAP